MKPLIVQSDMSILLQTNVSNFETVKDELFKFSEISLSPDSVYIFKITKLSIWNAIAMGVTKEYVCNTLDRYSKFPVPVRVKEEVSKWFLSYGVVSLRLIEGKIYLSTKDNVLKEKITKSGRIDSLVIGEDSNGFIIPNHYRGEIKHTLMSMDISTNDEIGFTKGDPLSLEIRERHLTDNFPIEIRDYQEESSQAISVSGSGAVILPCGSGKTMVGVCLMAKERSTTLIVTNSSASVNQWKNTLLNFTTLKDEDISCYSADNKVIAPVTICTYNMLAYSRKGEFIHFNKIIKQNYGLLIMDEVHLMPAEMFRIVASFQAIKRMALTATFIREDGRHRDIFTLIGPKRYEKPWKDLEARGYIAKVRLQEVRVPLSDEDQKRYRQSTTYQEKVTIATMSDNKIKVIRQLLERHKGQKILIIGQYTEQLEKYAKELCIPIVHGSHSDKERETLYNKLRAGEIQTLIASSIANAALDIPGISVVCQISFLGGSRNEETQRVGRCSRPKEIASFFYTLVSKDTMEEKQNFNRQRFLTGEGYAYEIKEMSA